MFPPIFRGQFIAVDVWRQFGERVIAAFARRTMKKMPNSLMNLGEFCRMFGVAPRTLRYWISTGRIRVVKIPNRRGGFSKRLKRIETLADLIALQASFIKSPTSSGPRFNMPMPKDAGFRKAVREFTSIMEKKGAAYQKRGKPMVAAWRNQQKVAQAKWNISDAEAEKKLAKLAAKIPL